MHRSLSLIAAALFAPTAAFAEGPSAIQLSQALRDAEHLVATPQVRRVHCAAFQEEPTEFHCTFERQARGGKWVRRKAIVAISGDGWQIIG